jgi:hypothetical protein
MAGMSFHMLSRAEFFSSDKSLLDNHLPKIRRLRELGLLSMKALIIGLSFMDIIMWYSHI